MGFKHKPFTENDFSSRLKDIWYYAAFVICRSLMKFPLFYNLKVEGRDNLPEDACIIASNHLSFFDPIFIVVGLKEKLYFLTKRYIAPTEGFEKSFYGRLVKSLDQIIMGDGMISKYTLKESLNLLNKNGKLGIFPEGTRSPDGKLGRLEEGTAVISDMSKRPVVPLYVEGSFELWPRNKKFPKPFGEVKLKIGKPLYVKDIKDKRDRRKDLTKRLEDSLNYLKSVN